MCVSDSSLSKRLKRGSIRMNKESYYNSILLIHMGALLPTHGQQNFKYELELLDRILELEKAHWRKEKMFDYSDRAFETVFA